MRVKLTKNSRLELFELIRYGVGVKSAAKSLRVCERTVRDWGRGKFTIPADKYHGLVKLAGRDDEVLSGATFLKDYWHSSSAGKKGGKVTYLRYGVLGDHDSRVKAGYRSYEARKSDKNDIFAPIVIRTPRPSKELAEFIGILIGDGGVTDHQVTVSLGSVVDAEYVPYVRNLASKLFRVEPSIRTRKNENCTNIVLSSTILVKYLAHHGLLPGNKLRNGLDVPEWIRFNSGYSEACFRGMFDTDGCIFAERHFINGREYIYPRMSLVSASQRLLESAYDILVTSGFTPKLRYRRVNLERFPDIDRYFKMVGTGNPKHLRRWNSLGEVSEPG